ncbi:putative leucine-rich repeat domain superfamily [Helianthus anomalus]
MNLSLFNVIGNNGDEAPTNKVNLSFPFQLRITKTLGDLISGSFLKVMSFFLSESFLKVLQMPMTDITDKLVSKHIKPLPNLTVLDVSHCINITNEGLKKFGYQCKSLLHLKRNMSAFEDELPDDFEAKAIADTMPHLQHIELCFGRFGDSSVSKILAKCKALTHLVI